ncbi:electron transfer flavoprotein subunit alpha/FixB family protein, partial [Kocuria rosea]
MTTTTTVALVVLGTTDRLRRADRELLVLAGTLGETHVVVPDAPGDALLGELVAHAVGTVHAPEGGPGDRLTTPAVALAEAAARETGAGVLLLAATPEAKDVAARLGVRLGAGVVTDGVALDADLVATKSVLAGGWTTRCRATSPVLIATVRPNSVEIPADLAAGAAAGAPGAGSAGVQRPRVRTHALEDAVPAARVVGRSALPA